MSDHSSALPIGFIVKDWSDPTTPFEIIADNGQRIECDGRRLKRNDYPELCAVLRDAFGSDQETFRVPLLKGRRRS